MQEKTAIHNEHQLNSGLVSKFHFVDLAGSERVSRTNNVGERFKGAVMVLICATSDFVKNFASNISLFMVGYFCFRVYSY